MALVEPVDAVLAIDIGNTRVGMGIWDGDGMHDAHRVLSDEPDAWRQTLVDTWREIDGQSRAVVIGSVVPEMTVRVQELVEDVCGQVPLRIRDDLPLPIELEVENPREIGIDRVCCAAAAFERVQAACAIASFGTATTIDCVSEEGQFLGGAILPGLDMCCAALHDSTAQLPRVGLSSPAGVFGRNTHDAIVAGVVYGALGAMREIVERYATELREWPQLVITGGNASLVAEMSDIVDAVVPDLCLIGIALAYRRAAGQM